MSLTSKPKSLLAVSLLGLWLMAACTPALPSTASPGSAATNVGPGYFLGKTITLVVNFSAGGPTDIFGRLLARHLAKHVPGNPTIVVQNMPGAGGKIGANHVYVVAKHDGLTIGVFTSPFANQILNGEGVQYDSAGFRWLGGVSEGDVAFVSSSAGVTRAEELPTTTAGIVVGGFTPDSGTDLSERTILDMWGVKYLYVSGYAGTAEASNALLRNEINFFQVSLSEWLSRLAPLAREGSVVPIGQSGVLQQGQVARDPRVPDIPTYEEIAIGLHGPAAANTLPYRASVALLKVQDTLLRAVVLPPGTDQAIVDALRQALGDTMADEEFKADARKSLGFELPFVSGADAEVLASEVVEATDKETLEYLLALSRQGSVQ